ncbi:MAG TPA: response regulator transcription factor [Beijerinckiaceae bacterium]|nr:response regulator transcription factor [Beijerinckiaceae bacterium]
MAGGAEAVSVIIADDHPLFRGALRLAVDGMFSAQKIVEAASLDEVLSALQKTPDVDLVLLDLRMPGMSGYSGLTHIRSQYPGVPVVIVSGASDPTTIRRCLDFGASGFIPKTTDIDSMRKAIRAVLNGGSWTPADFDPASPVDKETTELVRRLGSLTPQQMRVLMMLSEGLLNKQIAYELSVSEATVKAHVSAILTKLGVESRTQAVIAAAKIGVGEGKTAGESGA